MKDQAETGNYAETLQLIGSSLDNYLKFNHDDAQTNADVWQQQLDQTSLDYQQGNAEVLPTKGACEYCEYDSLCRIKK